MMNMNNLAQTHEILTPQLATKVGLTKFEFYKYVKANEYEQVRHGVYAAKDTWIDELEMLHRRCPMGVFSHDEAFYYYGLTDREPLVHTLTMAENSLRVRAFSSSNASFSQHIFIVA